LEENITSVLGVGGYVKDILAWSMYQGWDLVDTVTNIRVCIKAGKFLDWLLMEYVAP
jgi:hypothetical protein